MTSATKVGLVEPAPDALPGAITSAAARFDQKVAITTFPDAATADAALEGGSVDVVVAMPADLSGAGTVKFDKEPDQSIAQSLSTAMVGLRVQATLDQSNVDQGALAAAQQPPDVGALQPQTEADQARFLFANIGAVLILVGIFSFGFTVLTGVVEEKQSRVVEVVLATVRARDLLMGKVLGIGVLGVVQLFVFVMAALVAALATDRLVAADDDPGRGQPAGRLVRARLPAVLDRIGFPGRPRLADGGGLECLDPGHDDRDDQLLRGYLRRHRRARRHGRDDRHVPAAVGAVRRPVAGRLRRDPALADRRLGADHDHRHLDPVRRSVRGSTPGPCCRSVAG